MANPEFEELVVLYDKRLFNAMYAYTGDYHLALDVTEEAFIRACRAYGRVRGDSDPFTWLFRIAVNVFKKRYRKEKRRAELLAQHHEAEPPETIEHSTPETQALAAERAGLVRKAISSLPDTNRDVITLRYIDGMTYEEIARATAVSISTVKSRISRSKKMLADLLEDDI